MASIRALHQRLTRTLRKCAENAEEVRYFVYRRRHSSAAQSPQTNSSAGRVITHETFQKWKMKMQLKHYLCSVFIVFFCAWFGVSAFAQQGRGSLHGQVTDPSGAAI